MSFPDYVTLHWPGPGQPTLRSGVCFEAVSRQALGDLGSNPAHRLATRSSGRIDGSALRGEGFDPSNAATVPGNIRAVKIRFDFSTFRSGDSPVA